MKLAELIRKYTGALAVYCALMMTVLDGTIMNVALPSLTEVLHTSAASTIWIVNSYQLVITMLLLSFASLGDIVGYRRIFLTGITLFTAASAACALCHTLAALVACRVIQGVGAAAVMSVNIALVRMIYPPEHLGRGMGVNAMVVGVSTAAGPTLAGAIISIASWHWLFLINLPIGIAAFIIGRQYLPTNARQRGERFDTMSAVECALIFGLLIKTMDDMAHDADTWMLVTEVALLLIAAVFFVRRQQGRAFPLLPIDLLRIPIFSMSVLTSIASFCAQMLAMVSLPFFLTSIEGRDVMETGLLIAPWPIAVMIASPLAGRIVEHVHGGLLGTIGMTVFALGLFMLWRLPADASSIDIIWRMALCGIGYGTFQTPNNVTLIAASPRNRSGAASGMQGSARILGQTLGTTLVAVIFRLHNPSSSSVTCLLVAMCVALGAAVLSSLRLSQPAPNRG